MLDKGGRLSALFKDVSRCNQCRELYPFQTDHPVNLLVRPLPLQKPRNRTSIESYYTRIKRNHGFLRNLLEDRLSPSAFRERVASERFCIGLLPWLDNKEVKKTLTDTPF